MSPLSIPPLTLPVRGIAMIGVSVGRWGGLSETIRTTDIALALDLARTHPDLFATAAEYYLAQIGDAVLHAKRPGKTGTVLLLAEKNNHRIAALLRLPILGGSPGLH